LSDQRPGFVHRWYSYATTGVGSCDQCDKISGSIKGGEYFCIPEIGITSHIIPHERWQAETFGDMSDRQLHKTTNDEDS